MSTIDNILKFIDKKGMSVREFEESVKFPNATLGNTKRRKAELAPEKVVKIVEKYSTELENEGFYVINLEHLGHQGYAIVDSDEYLGEPYEGLLKSIRAKKDGELTGRQTIPFFDTEAIAGNNYSTDMNPITQPTSTIDIGDMLRDSQAAMRVYGNSMIPGYPPGSVIGLRRNYDGFIEPGTVYVIETKSNRYVKRLFYNKDKTGYICVSDNEIKYEHGPMQGNYYYPPFEIPFEAVQSLFDVTGVVKRNKNSAIVTRQE